MSVLLASAVEVDGLDGLLLHLEGELEDVRAAEGGGEGGGGEGEPSGQAGGQLLLTPRELSSHGGPRAAREGVNR